MPDREKIIECLELCSRGCNDDGCMYNEEETKRGGLSVCRCVDLLARDALTLLKEQETHDTRGSRIFQCKECGYGIEDIFLNSEHDYPINPVYCPNCGRKVKCE